MVFKSKLLPVKQKDRFGNAGQVEVWKSSKTKKFNVTFLNPVGKDTPIKRGINSQKKAMAVAKEFIKEKRKPYYIPEPFGLPFELTGKDEFKRLKK